MAVNIKDTATVGHVGKAAARAAAANAQSFKSLDVSGNTVNFYNSVDSTGTVAASFTIPSGVSISAASDGVGFFDGKGTLVFKLPVMI